MIGDTTGDSVHKSPPCTHVVTIFRYLFRQRLLITIHKHRNYQTSVIQLLVNCRSTMHHSDQGMLRVNQDKINPRKFKIVYAYKTIAGNLIVMVVGQ